MAVIQHRKVKTVTGNGTTAPQINITPGMRVHYLQMQMTYAGGTNTLAGLMTVLTEILVMAGSREIYRLSGTQLRDYVLHRGTIYDFNGLPNTGAQVTLPFAPEWFIDNVADALALNPKLLGAPIVVNITATVALTIVAHEGISDDLDAPSNGIFTMQVIAPVAGSTEFNTGTELVPRGRLMSAHIYPDSTNSNEITPVSLLVGANNLAIHDNVTANQNDELLERRGLTPAASGRTANIYDLVFVKADALHRAPNLAEYGKAIITIGAASAMAGTCKILLVRLEANRL